MGVLSVAAWLYIGSGAVASGLSGQSWLVTEQWMTRGLRKQSVGFELERWKGMWRCGWPSNGHPSKKELSKQVKMTHNLFRASMTWISNHHSSVGDCRESTHRTHGSHLARGCFQTIFHYGRDRLHSHWISHCSYRGLSPVHNNSSKTNVQGFTVGVTDRTLLLTREHCKSSTAKVSHSWNSLSLPCSLPPGSGCLAQW